MKSIQLYLRSRILWGSALILSIGSLVVALAIRNLDMNEFDEALLEKAQALATLVLREDHSVEISFAGEYMPEFERTENSEYFEFRLPDGTEIGRSASLGKHHMPFQAPDFNLDVPVFTNYIFPDGRKGRMIQISLNPTKVEIENAASSDKHFVIPPHIEKEGLFVVLGLAHGREELDTLLLRIYISLAGVDFLLLGLIALVVHIAIKKSFAPLASMNEQIRSLNPDSLERRIHLAATPLELQPVLSALNGFIEKLQTAFARERSFTNDVAHELRTPIAEFRVACDVGAKWSDDPELVRKRFENLRESAISMERKVNSLLELSRLDHGTVVVRKSTTVPADIVESCRLRLRDEKKLSMELLENRIDRTVTVETDAVKLDMIIHNFINNAFSYRVAGTAVVCTSESAAGGGYAIRISNQTEDLTKDDLKHIFERFWRKDLSRTDESHSGLGLAIAKELADVLNIRVEADLSQAGIFTISIIFSEN